LETIPLAHKPALTVRTALLTQKQIVLSLLVLLATVLVIGPLMILLRSSVLPAGELPFDT